MGKKKSTRRILVVDAETDPFKRNRVPAPFVWGCAERIDGHIEYREFRKTELLVEYLQEQDCICYAHNGGRFDWHFLLDYVDPFDELMLINGRIAKMRIGACECRDSYNLIPVPLSAYKKDDIDYAIMEPEERNKSKNRKLISAYLKSDCIYLLELVERFISEYGLQLTQAGAAMKQWQKISGTAPRTDKVFYDELSPYYYGGRVECFESGVLAGEFSVFDITSAYPRAMLERHPYSANYEVRDGYVEGADFYRVCCISHGAFPYRGEGGGGRGAGLIFPSDDVRRDYTITKWEYQAALDTDTISDAEVVESVSFMTHTDFSDYILYFFHKRDECKKAGDEAGRLFCKLFMNSLYGKFAANPDEYENFMIVPMELAGGLEAQGWHFAGEFGPWALASSPLQEERQRYYNVATGASITGYVRAMLWRAICSSGGVVYCDTDSITCREKGDAIILGDALGEWKDEGRFDKIGIGGKKMYIMRGKMVNGVREYKTAHKGVKLTHSQLWAVARGECVTYLSEAPTFSPRKTPAFVHRRVKFTA